MNFIIKHFKNMVSLFLSICLILTVFTPCCLATDNSEDIRILYTSDIHSNFENAGRLKTLIDSVTTENTIYLDAGDIAMGTFLQTSFSTDAFELRLLGKLGCDVVTVGNHEWDYGGYGFAKELDAASDARNKYGETLPFFVQSNIVFSGDITDEQKAVKTALEKYGYSDYTVLNVGNKKIAVFGLLGISGIEDSPTSGMTFENYIESAKKMVKKINEIENPDLIVCLSHSGTNGDGKTGEDFDLIDAVSGIDIVISGHSHTEYSSCIKKHDTYLVSPGCNMDKLGVLDIKFNNDGSFLIADNMLIPIDRNFKPDTEIENFLEDAYDIIGETYLSDIGLNAHDIIAQSTFDFMSLDDMYDNYCEYPMGNLIADSYIYEAEKNGINDIDVAFVGLGTVRGTFSRGAITVSDAFEMCSLGMGEDGSAGHPILGMYLYGKEIKLFAQLESSLYPLSDSIKFSSNGITEKINLKRMPFDRVVSIGLSKRDGSLEDFEDDKLYKVACNMYAANMLGMVNDLTKGIIKFVIKDSSGNPVDDLYSLTLHNTNGKEIKEWVALLDYLRSFDIVDGIPSIPEKYNGSLNRKVIYSEGGMAAVSNPGVSTVLIFSFTVIIVLIIAIIIKKVLKKKKRI